MASARRTAARPALIAAGLLTLVCGCARTGPSTPGASAEALASVDRADQLIAEGCLDCLTEAVSTFEALLDVPAVRVRATRGLTSASVLAAIRERELGLPDTEHLPTAQRLVDEQPLAPSWLAAAVGVANALPPGAVAGVGVPGADDDLERMLDMRRHGQQWLPALDAARTTEPAAAYAHLALTCASPSIEAPAPETTSPERPLLRFKAATCPSLNGSALRALLDADPRFVEAHYLLGLLAVGRLDLDGAQQSFDRAYAWRPRWPALTFAMANLAMTAEDFASALRLYDETLTARPGLADASLGRIRALTYLDRHDEAIAAATTLLEGQWRIGDARYWRALNEARAGDYEAAWRDVEAAATLLVNADVSKLGGSIAYRRGDLPTALARFADARDRAPEDCETHHYVGLVNADLHRWSDASAALEGALSCLERSDADLKADIARIHASGDAPDRQTRQVASRERQIAGNARLRVTSWFALAVTSQALGRPGDARDYASRVVDDREFGTRAKELLARLPSP